MDDENPTSNEPEAQPAGVSDPLVGRTFNERFKILSLIARGGMGAVYRAEQAPFGRLCALKVLQPRYEGDTQFEFHRRFFLEASIASKLTHPNNVTVFDYGRTDDGIYFMAMEYLEGMPLARAIRAEAPFPEERVTHIARQICRALREAHHMGVVHRDIKPGNIFLMERHDEHDFVKVLDFGLVKDVREKADEDLTQAGLFMGSPKYVAPEQIQGERVDARTDIYSLGIVLYEMVTGKVPFDKSSSVQTLIAHIREEIPALREMNPACNPGPLIEAIIFKCIAKKADDRFNSIDEILELLKQSADGALTATLMSDSGRMYVSSGAPPSGGAGSGPHVFMAGSTGSGPNDPEAVFAAAVAEQKRRRRRFMAIAAGAAGLAAAVGVSASYLGRQPPAPEPAMAAEPPIIAAPPMTVDPPVASAEPSASAAAVEPEKPPMLHIETTPAGAAVLLNSARGKKMCDETPCDLPWSELGEQKKLDLVIVKNGFVIHTEKVSPDDRTVSIRLVAVPVRAVPTKPATPDTYKNDPYKQLPLY